MSDYELADETVQGLVEDIARLKADEARAREERVHLEELLAKQTEGRGWTFADGEETVRVTVSRTMTERIEEALFSRLRPDLYESVSKPAVDRDKWREAVVRGDIPPAVAAEFTSTNEGKPRVTITRRSYGNE